MTPPSAVVVTTINPPTRSVIDHCEHGRDGGTAVVIVGDRKTPHADYHSLAERFPNLHVLSLDRQRTVSPALADALPQNHYARKNVGYAYAVRQGWHRLLDTDDDNLCQRGAEPGSGACAVVTRQGSSPTDVGFANVYALFTSAGIWPRGFPLDRVADPAPIVAAGSPSAAVAVWQGLVDGDPDVDAITRLTNPSLTTAFAFRRGVPDVVLAPGTLCPLNAQNVWWVAPPTFDLLYLPSTVSSRVCDIVRGYVAQHCLWRRGYFVGFTGPTAHQDRNPHDLMADLAEEVPLYLHAARMNRVLAGAARNFDGTPADLLAAYSALTAERLVGGDEAHLARVWLEALTA